MARPNRFQIMERNKKKILSALSKKKKTFFTFDELYSILIDNKIKWELPKSTTTYELINFLISKQKLEEAEFDFRHKCFCKYIYKETDILELSSSLVKDSYLSHYSAAYYHGLTDGKLKTVYINKEQAKKISSKENKNLMQDNINRAFSRPMRKTQNLAVYKDYKLYLLNGKYTNNLDVIKEKNINVTSIERTLIDIVVRPDYAGGYKEILNIYKNAKGKVSSDKICYLLKEMDFLYPYHQCIGFFMEQAQYKEQDLKIMEQMPINFNFYTIYNMKQPLFSDRWRVFYPID